jgi:hypothetical protein
MRVAKWFLVAVVVIASAGCASAPTASTAPPSVNVTGKWQGTWAFEQVSLGGGQIVMDLQQTGAQVTGNVTVTGPAVNRPTTIQAVVSGSDMMLQGRIPGTLTVSGDKMTGVVYGVVEANVTMQRQK